MYTSIFLVRTRKSYTTYEFIQKVAITQTLHIMADMYIMYICKYFALIAENTSYVEIYFPVNIKKSCVPQNVNFFNLSSKYYVKIAHTTILH